MFLLVGLLTACGTEPSKSGSPARPAGDSAVPEDSVPPEDSAPPGSTGEPPTEEPDHRLLITELMADNEEALVRDVGEAPDWIELHIPGPDPIDLTGFTLSDDPDDVGGTFSDTTLIPGDFLVVWADDDTLPFKLSADGETVVLRDADGMLVDVFAYGPQRTDVSVGRAQTVTEEELLGPGSTVRLRDGQPDAWRDPTTDDSTWDTAVLPVGFDTRQLQDSNELALFADTSQSSDGYGFTGLQAVDGDTTTFSHTADADLTPWWQVDLGELTTLSQVVVYNRLSCCSERLYNIVVEVRDAADTVLWASDTLNPVSEGAAPTDPGDWLAVDIDPPVDGQHVRVAKIAVNGARSSEWLSLAEVVVQGSRPAPYDDRIETDLALLGLEAAGEWVVRAPVPAGSITPLAWQLEVTADDGWEAVVDGVVVGQDNVDSPEPIEDDRSTVAMLPPGGGDTVLAVRFLDADGEDALLDLTLSAVAIDTALDGALYFPEPTPGAPNVSGLHGFLDAPTVDPPRGWLDGPTDLTLTAPDGADLIYTLDGTPPSADHGVVVESGTTTLSAEHTTLLRAIAVQDGWGDSAVATHTYLSMDDVLAQPAAPEGLPTVWDGLAQSAISGDYEMDPDVTGDPAYTDDLRTGLRAIPALSIVMDPDDLWSADDGIYIHSTQRGPEWERPTSMELIEPDGSSFQGDCGVRIHGYGWRPHSNTKKHSLRLEFRTEYGESKLEYPLFPNAPVDRFDSIVLRSQGSRGWQDFRDPEQAQYIRDAFARDTAYDMGKADGHAAYVHLFLNGLYWGLYMAVERPDADFGAERFGGDDAEYDAINRRTTTNEAIDGTLDAYNTLLARSDADLTDSANYAAVAELIDLEDLIDYMLIHQYTTNRDGPELYSHNNMRGVRRRVDGERFRFYVWDMEYSLWNATDDLNIDVDVAGAVSHVYAQLRSNPDFRALYATRAAQHLEAGGALTPEACLARYEARAVEIEDAVVAESARWGDTDRATPYTRDVEWAEERRRLTEEYFPQRTDVLKSQLRAAGLY